MPTLKLCRPANELCQIKPTLFRVGTSALLSPVFVLEVLYFCRCASSFAAVFLQNFSLQKISNAFIFLA
jgi:hypothetical protein